MAAVAAAKGGMIKLKTAKAIYLLRDAAKNNQHLHSPPPQLSVPATFLRNRVG